MEKFQLFMLAGVVILAAVATAGAYHLFSSIPQHSPPPAPQGSISCGRVVSHGPGMPAFGGNASVVMNCFLNAWKSDNNATMSLYYMGVDTGVTHNLSIITHYAIRKMVWDAITPSGAVGPKQPSTYVFCTNFTYGYNATYNSTGWYISTCSNNETIMVPNTNITSP